MLREAKFKQVISKVLEKSELTGQFMLLVPPDWIFPGLSGKESACHNKRRRRHGFDLWSKIPWKRKWTTNFSTLAGEIPWTKEPGSLESMGLQRVGHNLATEHT